MRVGLFSVCVCVFLIGSVFVCCFGGRGMVAVAVVHLCVLLNFFTLMIGI